MGEDLWLWHGEARSMKAGMQDTGATWVRGMEPQLVAAHNGTLGIPPTELCTLLPLPPPPSSGLPPEPELLGLMAQPHFCLGTSLCLHALGGFHSVHLINTYPSAESFLIHGTS